MKLFPLIRWGSFSNDFSVGGVGHRRRVRGVRPVSAVTFMAALLLGGQAPVGYPPVFVGNIEEGKPFNGGPYAGLAVGTATVPDGKTLLALKPSQPGASPVSARNAAAIRGLG